ncbi:DUF6377 domain-containing protein [Flavobacterium frigoris]|uniref:DUF6377 domain-containing protein n=1 Tax=Flavobacterium frigoris TaxID=229204 RepID=A0A1H9CVT6_FLAFI|nr:DUF6377 domain-containing protein [Flavobacterium frigoris]SEQ05284.1 hypothetical protein SAMN05444355_101286 [Flavobacterium frigoris]
MNRFLPFLFVFLFPTLLLAQENSTSLLRELDQTIENHQLYSNQKEHAIDSLKLLLKPALSDLQKQEVYDQLYEEYRVYKSDSALVFARKSVQIATRLKDPKRSDQAALNLASIMGTLGMYKEATDILAKNPGNHSPELKGAYFVVNRVLYGYMYDYATSAYEKEKYATLTQKHRDSSLQHFPKQSRQHLIIQTEQLIKDGQEDESLHQLLSVFPTISLSDPDRAIFAYIISHAYHQKKDREAEKKWLAISAISDLKLAKKENISLRNLAFLLYEEGDIDRAYKYIQRSLEDALFCNARLRTYEISKMMPIISEAYEHQNQKNQQQLWLFLVSVSLLTVILLIVLILLFKQMKKLKIAQKDLNVANTQLSELNVALHAINLRLKETNSTLTEANLVKEIYIGKYMDQCSDYIGKLEAYRRKLNMMATAGKMNNLISAIKSKQFIETELKEFYSNFDKTFLLLFPDFINEFEALLVDSELTQLKDGDLLNTELRIVALIRLGIKDSAKIAVFLRYSVSTIYNYRSQIKNKAAGPREEFEANVMQIGTKTKL